MNVRNYSFGVSGVFLRDFDSRYIASTFARAHGVRRRNLRLDDTLGSEMKHAIFTRFPIRSHPTCSTSSWSICSSVMPCKGLLSWPGGDVILTIYCLGPVQ